MVEPARLAQVVRAVTAVSWRVPAAAVITALLLVPTATAAPQMPGQPEGTQIVEVDVASPVGPLNRQLVGVGWHPGGAPLHTVQELAPHLVRIDASLEHVSTGPGAPLRLGDLLARVAEVRAIGAEPLVILSYLPAWLGEPRAFGRDPTRVRPADLGAWEQVVHDVVLALATAPAPARRFEAWNEPDVPLFWQDTPLAWVDTVERTGRAIARVERETGLDLAFGGPATAVPDPTYVLPFLARFRDPALPLDFISWHYYGNYPFFGPDGAEFPTTEPVQPVLGRPNPIASPRAFGPQVGFVGSLVDVGLAGSDRPRPALVLDEWNLSAAGFDLRHDTASGAAFAAGVLTELQAAGLDAAAFFRANDTRGVPGEHGLVTVDGRRKPSWWTFWLWQHLAGTVVATSGGGGPTDDLRFVATAGSGRIAILLSSFSADASELEPHLVRLDLRGLPGPPTSATVRRIDGGHGAAEVAEPLRLDGSRVWLTLPVPGVALVEIDVPGAGT